MRNLLLFGPFLWFRRVIFWILILLLLLVFVLYFVANSPLAVKKVVDTFAPDYNITYDAIKGNAFTGIEIVNPRYNNEPLATEIVLKWNPDTLANKKIKISKLHLKEANIKVIKALAAQFTSPSDGTQEQNSSYDFDFRVEIEDVSLSTQAFHIENIAVSSANFSSKGIFYKDTHLDIKDFHFNIESNITDIAFDGSYANQVVLLNEIKLLNINLLAIQGLMTVDEHNTEEQVSSTQTNALMPKHVNIKNAEFTLLPYRYDPVKIDYARLEAKALTIDVNLKMLTHANVELNATTNLSQLHYAGKIHNNKLLGKLILQPKKALYRAYEIPLRVGAIAEIEADIHASADKVVADIHTHAKQILEVKKGDFNLDIDSFVSHVVYDINASTLHADTQSYMTTPYAKDINITNHLEFIDGFTHQGEIYLRQIEGAEAKFLKPLQNLKISYRGDDTSIHTTFESEQLEGYFNSSDFKVAEVHVETIDTLDLASMLVLPPELNQTKAHVQVDAPLNLNDFSTIVAQVKVASNVVNIDANVMYAKTLKVDAEVNIPKESLLKSYTQDLAWDTLSPMTTTMVLKENTLHLVADAKGLKSNVRYGLDSGSVNGKLNISGLMIDIDGNTDKTIVIQSKIKSLKVLSKKLNTLYNIGELPAIEGEIDTSISIDKLKNMKLTLTAPKLRYEADRKTTHTINDVKLVLSMNAKRVLIKSYQATFNKRKFFSSKVAKIELGERVYVSNLWINDGIQIEGDYSPTLKEGIFTAKANNFHVKDKMLDIYSKVNLTATLDGNNTRVEGKVLLLKGTILPQIEGRTFATDSDIVILQEIHASKNSPFMDNLSLLLTVETQKPLYVKQKGLRVKIKPNFTITKENKMALLYLGSVDLLAGGSDVFKEKKFVLAKSAVYFTGDINKPILDIKANYQALNHFVTIAIKGTPAEPNIHFSSSPSLTREQILSLILFDAQTDGDTHSGNEMMRMMGGAMAKAALSDVGVKVDHLSFGEGNSVEVGKKLTPKITVIYINEEVPKVKLKYKHGKRTESVIGVSEESQSYDIVYKRDF
jgi:translocation and assembly module TamB